MNPLTEHEIWSAIANAWIVPLEDEYALRVLLPQKIVKNPGISRYIVKQGLCSILSSLQGLTQKSVIENAFARIGLHNPDIRICSVFIWPTNYAGQKQRLQFAAKCAEETKSV